MNLNDANDLNETLLYWNMNTSHKFKCNEEGGEIIDGMFEKRVQFTNNNSKFIHRLGKIRQGAPLANMAYHHS